MSDEDKWLAMSMLIASVFIVVICVAILGILR
jgi:hypothetical protein